MGCGSTSGRQLQPPPPSGSPIVLASNSPVKPPPLLVQASDRERPSFPNFKSRGGLGSQSALAFGSTSGSFHHHADPNEALFGSVSLRSSALVSPRAGAPSCSNASASGSSDAGGPPPPPIAPRAAVTPPMAARPLSVGARDGVRTPTSTRSHPLLGWMEDSIEGSTIMGSFSPRLSRDSPHRSHSSSPRHAASGALSTASSTPRRFHQRPLSSRGLRCGIVDEDDILDLYEEAEVEMDKAVSLEIQGWMANIHVGIIGCALDGVNKSEMHLENSLPSKRHPLAPISTEEEKLMQEILEDETET